MDYFKIVLAFLLAGITAFAVTPLAKRFAYVIGAVDVPRDNRRMHKEPIPRAGGLAFFAGFLVAILIFGTMDRQMMTVLIGCLIIVTLGILDDILQLPAWIKFIAEVAAASIPVVWGGLRIEFFTNFNLVSDQRFFYLGYLSIPVTILWIVGVTNAVNMIDGLDGLAAGISTISSVSLLVVCCVTGDLYVAVVMACLAGGLVGFLPYNFNPAQIPFPHPREMNCPVSVSTICVPESRQKSICILLKRSICCSRPYGRITGNCLTDTLPGWRMKDREQSGPA